MSADELVDLVTNLNISESTNKTTIMPTVSDITSNHLNVIPKYDGEPATLPIFLSACEYLISTFCNNKNPGDPINEYLLRVVTSKLEGRALLLIGSREEAKNWGELKALLQNYFGDQRDERCLARDLQDIRPLKGESPYKYGMRCQDVRGLLLTKLKLSEPDAQKRTVKMGIYDDLALQTYPRGLPENLRAAIRTQRPDSLEKAMSLVIEEENFNYTLNRNTTLNEHRNYSPIPKITPAMPKTFHNVQQPPTFYGNQYRPQNLQPTFRNPINFQRTVPQGPNPFFNLRQPNFNPVRYTIPRQQQSSYPRINPPQQHQVEPMDTSSGNTRISRPVIRENAVPQQRSEQLYYQETAEIDNPIDVYNYEELQYDMNNYADEYYENQPREDSSEDQDFQKHHFSSTAT